MRRDGQSPEVVVLEPYGWVIATTSGDCDTEAAAGDPGGPNWIEPANRVRWSGFSQGL